MGASASKGSRAGRGAAARKYPTRTPATASNAAPQPAAQSAAPAPQQQHRGPGPTVHPHPHASTGGRDEAINLDASDPDFAQSLRSLGAVQPNPTLSPTSAFNPSSTKPSGPDPRKNPALTVLDARARLQDAAEREFLEAGRRGHAGRRFLDVGTIRQVLAKRDGSGKSDGEIERQFGLAPGVVALLGARGVVEAASEVGRAEKSVEIV